MQTSSASNRIGEFPRTQSGFYKLFTTLKNHTNSLIADFRANDPMINPSIDSFHIAATLGLSIQTVSEQQSGHHALLINNIIFLNEKENHWQHRFSVAHEIGHHLFSIPENNSQELIAARMGNTWKNKTFASLYSNHDIHVVKELLEEESLDYFAANLLMPAERFILWEDRTDREIAQAFGVTEKCAAKRREEIPEEMEILSNLSLSSAHTISHNIMTGDEIERELLQSDRRII